MMKTSDELVLPPGFRFHPTDEELVYHYLSRKCAGLPIAVPIIAEIDLYKFDPWQLPDMALYGEKEWYFFSPRDRKYPNGSRPNRAAGCGYWKATGADKPIGKPKALGIKKALVFYAGKAPRGIKTNWIMHEYRPANVDRSAANNNKKNNSTNSNNYLRLDDWVLCRLYNKKGRMEKYYPVDNRKVMKSVPELVEVDQKPDIKIPPQNLIMPPQHYHHHSSTGMEVVDQLHTDTSESVPRLQTDSSCSEHVLSPEFTGDKEVQSEPKWNELDAAFDDLQFNYLDGFQDDPFAPQFQYQMEQISPLQDMFMLLQKPF